MGSNSRLAAEIAAGMAVMKIAVDLAQREAEYRVRLQKRLDDAQERRDAFCASTRHQG